MGSARAPCVEWLQAHTCASKCFRQAPKWGPRCPGNEKFLRSGTACGSRVCAASIAKELQAASTCAWQQLCLPTICAVLSAKGWRAAACTWGMPSLRTLRHDAIEVTGWSCCHGAAPFKVSSSRHCNANWPMRGQSLHNSFLTPMSAISLSYRRGTLSCGRKFTSLSSVALRSGPPLLGSSAAAASPLPRE